MKITWSPIWLLRLDGHYGVIKITYIVSVQFKRYVHCSLLQSGLSCILFANFSRDAPNLILGG